MEDLWYFTDNMGDDVLVYETKRGSRWYVKEGCSLVNLTYDELSEGDDLSEVRDDDCFTWTERIFSLDDLKEAVEFG